MEVITQNPAYWSLMWVVLAIAILIVVGLLLRRRAMRRFASIGLLKHLAPHISEGRKRIKAVLFILALALIVAGLVDIRWGKVWTDMPQRGVDIIFALDVSRSMQAQDVSPDRLTRAKEYIRDMMAEMGGDRVGLITFAGKTKQLVPLTSNYSDVNIALDEVSTQSVSRGGSLLGDAIRAAADAFVDKTADHKAIVVITDGEDHESYPVEAAQKIFKEKGIRVYTVGLGDRKTGARIPVQTTAEGNIYLKHNGQEVWSKMDGKILEQTALAGGGAYIPAGTKHVDMAGVYDQHIRAIQQREFRQARVNQYIPRFQWFLGAAVLLLLIESLISPSRKPRFLNIVTEYISDDSATGPAAKTGKTGHSNQDITDKNLSNPRVPIVLIVVGLAMVLAMSASASAEEIKPSELVRTGNQALAAGDADTALAAYKKAKDAAKAQGRELPEFSYNQAVALYRKGEYEKAQEHLREALANSQAGLEAKARFNMGNCSYAAALPLAEKDKKLAIENLKQAINHYRDALTLNENDADTRANIELAQLMVEKLQKEQKQEDKKKQDKKQDKKNDKQNQKQDKNKDQQKKDDPKNKDDKKDKKPQEQNKQSKPDDKKQQKNEQQKDKGNKQAKDKQENKDKQKQTQPKPDKDDKKQKSEKGKGQAGSQEQQAQAKPKKMSPEEAAKLLQAVRDKNLKRRKEKMERMRVRAMPVEKDW